MATWQFTINLIPNEWAIKHNNNFAPLYNEDGYDTDMTWINHQPTTNFKELFTAILPQSKSWSKNMLCWGKEDEHDIQVLYQDNKVEGIGLRLDLNQNLKEILTSFVNLANNLDCVFFFPEYKEITKATETELIKALKKSRAASFVKDPYGYLNELQN